MSLAAQSPQAVWSQSVDDLRCLACDGELAPSEPALACHCCGAVYPFRDDVLIVRDQPAEDNRIARDFYNSTLWPKFRFWEWFFFIGQGGERRARNVILRHLPLDETGSRLTRPFKLLDVAIGDGAYLGWLPADWRITGIDVSAMQLASCRRRNPVRPLRLILGEAEALPFRAQRFDAVLSIGGFNHFSDPEAALREMVRVVPSGAPIVISDELPDLTERMLGRKLGLPGLDRWVVARLMNLGYEFTDLVERHKHLNIAEIGKRVLKDCRYEVIWRGGGYLMTGFAP
ncbi:MAG: class I SAM-dependent methyltransferase [Isosphaeraceae bacterium]|nr:class I SAM-dependent methyltransferase [Isosphaeraceae bacterium]